MRKHFIARYAFVLGFAVAIAGCGGTTTSTTPAATQRPVGGFSTTAHVTFKNGSARCAWMTAYWSYQYLRGWYTAEGQGANPRLLKPGETWKFNIDYNDGLAGNPDIRIQAEFFDVGDSCHGTGPSPILVTYTNITDSASWDNVYMTGDLTNGTNNDYHINLSVTKRDILRHR